MLSHHEYLADGRTIVSTDLSELRPYDHLVSIAESYEEFIYQIGEALHDCSLLSIEASSAVSYENSWDQRIVKSYHIL